MSATFSRPNPHNVTDAPRPDRLRIAFAQVNQRVGDLSGNMERMLDVRARAKDADDFRKSRRCMGRWESAGVGLFMAKEAGEGTWRWAEGGLRRR